MIRPYRRLLLGLSVGGHALAFLIPSALVRALIIAPVLTEAGFDDRSGRVGLYLGPAFATFYGPAGILTADLPNIMLTEFGSSITDHHITWTEWLFPMYPIMGLTRVGLVCGIVYYLFRLNPSSSFVPPTDPRDDAPRTERPMLAALLVGAAIWATDFVHGLHPVVGAVVVVTLAFLPRIGVADFESSGVGSLFPSNGPGMEPSDSEAIAPRSPCVRITILAPIVIHCGAAHLP